MRRLSLALSILGLSTSVLAALPATTDPTLVAVPQLPGGFVIGGSALYLEPSVTKGALDYAFFRESTTNPFSIRRLDVEPGYDWGWGINLGYIFPNTGNDINVNYFHFDVDDTDFAQGPPGSISIGENVVNPIFYNRASAKSEIDLNQIDLTFGQFIDIGCRLQVHPNVGVRYLDLERKLDSYFQFFTLSGIFSDDLNVNSKADFSGVGPLLGVDGSYYLGYGFGIVGHADTALLVGNADPTDHLVNRLFILPTTSSTSNLTSNSTRQIVPVVDGKLGADYTFVFNNNANSDLTLEVGYQVDHYFNAIDRHNILRQSGVPVSYTAVRNITSSLGLNGPYVNLTLHI